MSFTVVVVTLGPLSESLMSRRNTDKFCVNLKKERKKITQFFKISGNNSTSINGLYFVSQVIKKDVKIEIKSKFAKIH